MYYTVHYTKKCPITPKMALKHNAESAIMVTYETTKNNNNNNNNNGNFINLSKNIYRALQR